jgi:Rrf2 family transcriptional regulator, iron-sulfur cluster assembly transcription factor
MLSSACKDALRALVYLASKQDSKLLSISKISSELDLPFHFLSKTMQKLIKAGILSSSRGASGGVMLAKDTAAVKVFDVVKAIDGEGFFDNCVLGIAECQSENPCALHSVWESRRDEWKSMLEATTLAELADDVKLQKTKRL